MKKRTVIVSTIIIIVITCVYLLINIAGTDNETFQQGLKPAKDALKQVVLTFYFPGEASKDTWYVLDEIEKRTSGNLNIKLDFKYLEKSNFFNNIRLAILSGFPCDIFYYSNEMNKSNLSELENKGVLADITDTFPKYAPEYYRKFTKDELSAATVKGKLLAIPGHLPQTQRRHAIVRDDMMRKYDLKNINSLNTYEVYMEKIRENELNLTPMLATGSSLELFAENFGYVIFDKKLQLVYKWNDPDMKLIAWEQTPEYKTAVGIIKKWHSKGYFKYGKLEEPSVISGNYASFTGPLNNEEVFNTALKANTIFDWRYRAYPLYPDKAAQKDSPLKAAIAFSPESPNIERATKFIEWVESSRENYDLMMYGIKGEQYELYGEQYDIPKGVKLEDAYLKWEGRLFLGNIDLERVSIANPPDFFQRYLDEVRNGSGYPPHMNFNPEYPLLFDGILSNRKSAVEAAENKIWSGSFTDIDNYIYNQKNNGFDEIVKLTQKQLDGWKKSN